MSEWISVKDRLPGNEEMVLAYIPGWARPVTVGEYLGSAWALVSNIGTCNDIAYESKPTHWMPLPEPPTPDLTIEEALKLAVMDLSLFADHFMGGTKATHEGIGNAIARVVRYREVLERAGKW